MGLKRKSVINRKQDGATLRLVGLEDGESGTGTLTPYGAKAPIGADGGPIF